MTVDSAAHLGPLQVSLQDAGAVRSNPEPSHDPPLCTAAKRLRWRRTDRLASHSNVDCPKSAWRTVSAWQIVNFACAVMRGSCFGFVSCGEVSREPNQGPADGESRDRFGRNRNPFRGIPSRLATQNLNKLAAPRMIDAAECRVGHFSRKLTSPRKRFFSISTRRRGTFHSHAHRSGD